jgi:two-component system cell cycle sensor histidine kinase/response regulator CckA
MKVLLCSGYSADGERSELLREGAAGFLQKPFDTIDLASSVREILDR